MTSSLSNPPRVPSNPGSDDYDAALPGKPWEKRRRILRHLFEDIEPKYDRLNRALSLGIDQGWRRWCAGEADPGAQGPWVDVASGTGDLATFIEKRVRERGLAGASPSFFRVDLSAQLLRAGTAKLEQNEGATSAEMDRLPLVSSSLGAIFQGFALRHCRDYGGFFDELYRVLQPGGQALILDMRYPEEGFGAGFYRFYFRSVLPRLAGWLGADEAAYRFMVDSVRALPGETELIDRLRGAGFTHVTSKRGFLGAVRLLIAEKE